MKRFGERPLRGWSRHARAMCAAGAAIIAGLIADTGTLACGGTPPPTCGMTYVFTKSGEFNVTTSGGVMTIDTLHYLNIVELPAGNGLCPPGPYFVTMTVALDCTPDPDFGPALFGPFLLNNGGFTNVPLVIAIPAGPPRVCSLTITADILLADGTTLSKVNKQEVCIVEEITPGVPRLDLQLLGPSIAAVHPGDQSSSSFRLTNNDPTHSFTGLVTGDMETVAKMPGGTSPYRYAVSDPGPGDNYPIQWGDSLPPGGCIPLPPDPHNVLPQVITRSVTLLPGEFVEFDLVARPWGMCADGSCGEGLVVADGTFADGTSGIACAGVAVQVDSTTPPQLLWADAGVSSLINPFGPPGALLVDPGSEPFLPPPGPWLALPDPTGFQQIFVNGLPEPVQSQTSPMPITPYNGRLQTMLLPFGTGWSVDSFFDIDYRINFQGLPSQPDVQVEIVSMSLVGGAPFGFENVYPFLMGTVRVHNNDFTVDSFFDIMWQFKLEGLMPGDPLGQPLSLMPSFVIPPGNNGLDLHLQAVLGPGVKQGVLPSFAALRLTQDFRAFARPVPPPACPGDITGPGGVPDGQVDVDDLNAILSVFGTPVPPGDPRDVANNDGFIDVDDLNVVLANFGCP